MLELKVLAVDSCCCDDSDCPPEVCGCGCA
jgi:hypothetical protein